jgi:hypothetical protein
MQSEFNNALRDHTAISMWNLSLECKDGSRCESQTYDTPDKQSKVEKSHDFYRCPKDIWQNLAPFHGKNF